MDKQRRTGHRNRTGGGGILTKLFAHTGGNPEDLENEEWYLDSPDLRLSRVFSVVLVLHIIAVGGILAFKMIDKASGTSSGMVLAKAEKTPSAGAPVQRETAGNANAAKRKRRAAVPPPESVNSGEYRVIAGDTLSEIAFKVGVSIDALSMANGIESPDEISPGMILQIPIGHFVGPSSFLGVSDQIPEDSAEQDVEKADLMNRPPVTVPAANGLVHQVRKGETAWALSQRFGVSPQRLLEFNGIEDPKLLQEGQLLQIPTD